MGGDDCSNEEALAMSAECIRDKLGRIQVNLLAPVSKKACQSLKDKIKSMEIYKRSGLKIDMVAELINPVIREWMNYFGKNNRSAIRKTLVVVQMRLVKWAMCKFKHFRGHRRRAEQWQKSIKEREPNMFAHWALC